MYLSILKFQWQDKSKHHSILLVVFIIVSTCIDIDWLSYKYFPGSLGEEDLAYRIHQDTSLVWIIVWYSLLVNCFLKVLCLNESLKKSYHGNNIRAKVLERGGNRPNARPVQIAWRITASRITASKITASKIIWRRAPQSRRRRCRALRGV